MRFDYVEDTETSPLGFLEGIFIKEDFRLRGYARSLVKEAKEWTRKEVASEFASDRILENTTSIKFHLALGFE